MLAFVTVIHLFIAVLIIFLVLIQDSSGGALGSLGGSSGANSVFGSAGAGNFLTKATTWAAIVFAATSIYLAYESGHHKGSVLDDLSATAPTTIQKTTPTQPEKPVKKKPDQKEQKPSQGQ